jgi:hypothetical protein
MVIIFKHRTFYNYYMNPINTILVNPSLQLWVYQPKNKYAGTWNLNPCFSSSKVMIQGIDVYITAGTVNWLYFHFPRYDQSQRKYLGDHITFGLKQDYKTTDIHITIQDDVNGIAVHSGEKCFIKDGMDIGIFEEVQCQQPAGKKVKDCFHEHDIEIIRRILQRPFTPIVDMMPGGYEKKGYINVKGQKYRICVGKRGGTYIISEKGKKYIKIQKR